MNENELEIMNLDEATNTLSTENNGDNLQSLLFGLGVGALAGAGITFGAIALFKHIKASKEKKAAEAEKEDKKEASASES